MSSRFVVVGGGIAGVSCAEELSRLCPESSIHLVSGSPLIKAVTNFTKISRALERFDVKEKPASYITQSCPNVRVYQAKLLSIDPTCRTAKLSDGSVLNYDKICLCTGATPSLIVEGNPLVLGVRDVESVQELQGKLQQARRVLVVGNGGIATELVYKVQGCEVVWAIKDHSIGHTFFDEGAATFFLPHLVSEGGGAATEGGGAAAEGEEPGGMVEVSPLKRTKYTLDKRPAFKGRGHLEEAGHGGTMGGALGPDWHSDLKMIGKGFDEQFRHVHVEYKCEVKEILKEAEFKARGTPPTPFPGSRGSRHEKVGSDSTSHEEVWPVYVALTNGHVFGCDLVVSATGVSPNAGGVAVEGGAGEGLTLAEDGGVVVDQEMRTNLRDVYAAGDVCSTQWGGHSNLWFQMRLWTQARQMGAYAARCMDIHSRGETATLDFCFELFSHVTSFFGYKVVLLGLYNGQTLGKDYTMQLRCTKGVEYVKVLLQNGRMVGAVLIGETDLEETFENLMLNQMDLSQLDLLEPTVDLEDFFD